MSLRLMLMLSVCAPAFAQAPWPLLPAPQFDCGIQPDSIALADLNLDGHLDLIANAPPTDIVVRLGNGLGNFGPPSTFPSGAPGPVAISAGDLNGDGKPDVVCGHSVGNNFALMLGDGAGHLASPTFVAIASDPTRIALGDLDGAPGLDCAIACRSGVISILLNNGSGTLTAAAPLNVPNAIFQSVAIAHLDADALPDIVGVASNQGVRLFKGLGGGAFAPLPNVAEFAMDVVASDFSGDGKTDLAFSTFGPQIPVWIGDGLGGFSALATYSGGSQAYGIAAADLDQDGRLDLATVSFAAESVTVLRGLAGGAFAQTGSFPACYRGRSIAIGRVDQDGLPDVMVGPNSSFGPVLLRGAGAGALLAGSRYSHVPGSQSGLASGDFNGDGIDDILSIGGSSASVQFGNGAGGFLPAISSAFLANASSPVVADFNNDGFDDVAVVYITFPSLFGGVVVMLSNGTGAFTQGQTLSVNFGIARVAVGDLDLNGKPDLVFNETYSTLRVFLGQGNGSFVAAGSQPLAVAGAPPNRIMILRVDGDTLPDVLTFGSSAVTFCQGSGAGNLQPAVFAAQPGGSQLTGGGAGDFDGDGIVDLATGQYQSDMRLWHGIGNGTFMPTISVPSWVSTIEILDLDQDGHAEVCALDASGVLVLSGTATGPIGPGTRYRGGLNSQFLAQLQLDPGTPRDLIIGADTNYVMRSLAPAPCSGIPYCTAKVNSLGCTPAIFAVGSSSATASSGFTLSASNVRNQKAGLLLYGIGVRAATPLSGGLLCMAPPVKRGGGLTSGGSPLPINDCSGAYQLDMNTFAGSAGPPVPIAQLREPGVTIHCQFWGRDPGFSPPNNTTLSDALEYTVCP